MNGYPNKQPIDIQITSRVRRVLSPILSHIEDEGTEILMENPNATEVVFSHGGIEIMRMTRDKKGNIVRTDA